MRHDYAKRLAVVMTVLLIAAAALFSLAAVSDVGTGTGEADAITNVLEVDADPSAGEELYVSITDPPCASCHTLDAAGARSDRATDLDERRPTERDVVVSIVGDHIGAHEAQDYRIELSDRELADLSAYIEEVSGN